jgi:hypothetical protein
MCPKRQRNANAVQYPMTPVKEKSASPDEGERVTGVLVRGGKWQQRISATEKQDLERRVMIA